MEVYKTPESNVEVQQKRAMRPVRAIVYGGLISIVLGAVIATLIASAYGVVNGINMVMVTLV